MASKRKGPTLTVSSVQKAKYDSSDLINSEKENLSRPPRSAIVTKTPITKAAQSRNTPQSSAALVPSRTSSNKQPQRSDSVKKSFPGKENEMKSSARIATEDSDREILRAKEKKPNAPSTNTERKQARGEESSNPALTELLSQTLLGNARSSELKQIAVKAKEIPKKSTKHKSGSSSLDQYDEVRQILERIQREHDGSLEEGSVSILQEHNSMKEEVLKYLRSVRENLIIQKQRALPEYRNLLAILKNAKTSIEESKRELDRKLVELEKAKNDKSIEEKFEKIVKNLKKQVCLLDTIKLFLMTLIIKQIYM